MTVLKQSNEKHVGDHSSKKLTEKLFIIKTMYSTCQPNGQ